MSSTNDGRYLWLGSELKWRVIGVLIVLILAAYSGYRLFLFDEYRWIMELDNDERFVRTIDAVGTGTKRVLLDRLLPSTIYERVSFSWAGGGNIVTIFRDPMNENTRRAVSELPQTLTSFDQLAPLKGGLIIYFLSDVVEGYEWKGYKTGMLREQIPPERRVPAQSPQKAKGEERRTK